MELFKISAMAAVLSSLSSFAFASVPNCPDEMTSRLVCTVEPSEGDSEVVAETVPFVRLCVDATNTLFMGAPSVSGDELDLAEVTKVDTRVGATTYTADTDVVRLELVHMMTAPRTKNGRVNFTLKGVDLPTESASYRCAVDAQ